MGAGASAQEVRSKVEGLGSAYAVYGPALVENGVDGALCAELATEPTESVTATFADLGVTSALHRRKLLQAMRSASGLEATPRRSGSLDSTPAVPGGRGEDVGVFAGASDGGLKFDPSASLPPDLGGHPRSRELYEFFGRFIGKALLERVPLDARLASPIYAQLLGRVVEFEDLRCLDEDLAKNLKWLLTQKDVGGLGLDFSVSIARRCPYGNMSSSEEFVAASSDVVVKELVENGKNTPVTNENVDDYVRSSLRVLPSPVDAS